MTQRSHSFAFTAEQLTAEAASLLEILDGWPDVEVEDVVKSLIRLAPLPRGAPYYGIQAVLLMLIVANDAKWPPMPPAVFASGLPEISDQIARYAKNVALVELQEGLHH